MDNFCSNCGVRLVPDANFCSKCGNEVNIVYSLSVLEEEAENDKEYVEAIKVFTPQIFAENQEAEEEILEEELAKPEIKVPEEPEDENIGIKEVEEFVKKDNEVSLKVETTNKIELDTKDYSPSIKIVDYPTTSDNDEDNREIDIEFDDEDEEEVLTEKVSVDFSFDFLLKNMIKCPTGSFLMGSPIQPGSLRGKVENGNEEYQHKVVITKPFKICKYPVTQLEYLGLTGLNPSKCQDDPRNPVENVSWYEAKEFCEKLNKVYAERIPLGYKFDLPTEAQWEYACRAGCKAPLYNGGSITSEKNVCSNLDQIAWYVKNTTMPKPVGMKKPNNWGLYDMLGNVLEWCNDWYGSYNKNDYIDPAGPSIGSHRIVRGGSWLSAADYCRCAFRSYYGPAFKNKTLGFRVALVRCV